MVVLQKSFLLRQDGGHFDIMKGERVRLFSNFLISAPLETLLHQAFGTNINPQLSFLKN
jgi:hypothetical protein